MGWIRVIGWIWGPIVHQSHPETPIHPVVLRARRNTRRIGSSVLTSVVADQGAGRRGRGTSAGERLVTLAGRAG
jgi:hypothetical protein